MQFLQQRKESKLLLIYRHLNFRTQLTKDELGYLDKLEKGFKGEVMFDTLLKPLNIPCLVISDLLLEVNHSTFQIDSFIITPIRNYLFEVKNNEGDYFVGQDGDWYTSTKTPVKNPIHQLSRSETLFRQLLNALGLPLTINPLLVFINPYFTLFNAPMKAQILLPTQIDRFITQLSQVPQSHKLNSQHEYFANQLIVNQIKENPYNKVPAYTYDKLNKGIVCEKCRKVEQTVFPHFIVCNRCHYIEELTHSIFRSIEEYQLLFPARPLTVNSIFDWCGGIVSKSTIRRTLNMNYSFRGSNPKVYY